MSVKPYAAGLSNTAVNAVLESHSHVETWKIVREIPSVSFQYKNVDISLE